MPGYGSEDKPLPWLGPQTRVVEVHWPPRNIVVFVIFRWLGTGVVPDDPEAADAVYISFINALGYYTSAWLTYIHRTETFGDGVPRIHGAREIRKGYDKDPEEGDSIDLTAIKIDDMPEAKEDSKVEWGPWTVFPTGFVPVLPEGEELEFNVPGMRKSGGWEHFRAGTDIKLKIWDIPKIGPPKHYGVFIGQPNSPTVRPIAGVTWPIHYTDDKGDMTINFADARFTYKKKEYKVIGRFPRQPYTKETQAEPFGLHTGGSTPADYAWALLCEPTGDEGNEEGGDTEGEEE